MHLRKLKFLNLEGTQIDYKHYGFLLSKLQNIANIRFWKLLDDILGHVTVDSLDTITHVSGLLHDIETVTQRCPNTKNITLNKNWGDLSGLTDFKSLRVLEIQNEDYRMSNLDTALRGIGHRLTDMKLICVRNVNQQKKKKKNSMV
jgi:hypothetical protein